MTTTYYIAHCPRCNWQQRYAGIRPIFGNPTDSEGVKNYCPFCHKAKVVIRKEPIRQ